MAPVPSPLVVVENSAPAEYAFWSVGFVFIDVYKALDSLGKVPATLPLDINTS